MKRYWCAKGDTIVNVISNSRDGILGHDGTVDIHLQQCTSICLQAYARPCMLLIRISSNHITTGTARWCATIIIIIIIIANHAHHHLIRSPYMGILQHLCRQLQAITICP